MTGSCEPILLVQCLYRGDLHANVPCVPMAEAAGSRELPAPHRDRDAACCSPFCGSRRAAVSPFSELCCNWNCKCPFLVFMGQKTRWLQLREGADLATDTGQPALEDAAVTIQLVL